MIDLVSVIIPTYERNNNESEKLLKRALDSVFRQTYNKLEVIVVIDGVSASIKKVLSKYYSNVVIIESVKRVGGGTTRNIGINSASGEWIAFLDDDDEWEDKKIEVQLDEIQKIYTKSDLVFSFSSCKRGQEILPDRKYLEGPLGEYLFIRKKMRSFGFIQTSTIMISRILSMEVMFTDGLPKHQDWDYCLNLDKYGVSKIIHVDYPLSYYHDDAPVHSRVGKSKGYEYSLNWIHTRKNDVSTETFNSFIINFVFSQIILDDKILKKEKIKKILKIYFSLSGKDKYHFYNVIKMILIISKIKS